VVHNEEKDEKPKRLLEARSGGDGDSAWRAYTEGHGARGKSRIGDSGQHRGAGISAVGSANYRRD
jgi:hypothetical protein